MDFNYVRRFCAYVSTFYHSEYITPLVTVFVNRHPIDSIWLNGPKIWLNCIFENKYLAVLQDFCQKSHK